MITYLCNTAKWTLILSEALIMPSGVESNITSLEEANIHCVHITLCISKWCEDLFEEAKACIAMWQCPLNILMHINEYHTTMF